MKLFTPMPFLVLILSLFCAQIAHATTPTSFAQGLEASNDGDHTAALDYFQQAHTQGMDNGRLHYNIGVSHFKLGQYPLATMAFQRAATDSTLAGLAYYNLALVAYQQNQAEQGRHWLQRCRDSTDDPRLLGLAKVLQARLSPSPPAMPPSNNYYLLSINAGHDGNVTLRDDNESLNVSSQTDQLLESQLFYQHRRSLREQLSLSFDASLYRLDYLQLDNYDIGLFRFGSVLTQEMPRHWQLRGDAHISQTTIAGNSSTRTLSLQGGVHHKRDRRRIELDFQIARITAINPNYNHLSGWRYQLIAKTSWRQARYKYNLKATVSHNDRNDFRSATRFSSYSPQRLRLSGKLRMPLGKKLKGSLKLDWRHSRYRDANLLSDNSLIRRIEQRWSLTAALKHPLNKNLSLQVDYRYSNNNSTLDRYNYHRSQLRLGIQRSW